MKKSGIIFLIAGILTMGYAAFQFINQKNAGSEEQVQKEALPFPWLPTAGALLTAGGIILIVKNKRLNVKP